MRRSEDRASSAPSFEKLNCGLPVEAGRWKEKGCEERAPRLAGFVQNGET